VFQQSRLRNVLRNSHHVQVPNLGQFKPEEFIGWVKKGLPPALKSRKGNWLRLYR
jgi:hypothetical protein